MADHLDVPGLIDLEGHLIGPPAGDPRIDITDIYAFVKPHDATRSILILNVNPLTLSSTFRPDAIYELKVDTDGDAVANVAFRIQFSEVAGDGSQSATVRRAEGPQAIGRDNTGAVIISSAPVSFGSSANITTSGDFKFFAGRRSDPFFFDLLGFFKSPITFTGSDFFVDKNVFGIVLEMPNAALGSNPSIGVWGRCLVTENGDMVQIDRMGRPAINTVFMKGTDKVKFNMAEPHTDVARFTDNVVSVLKSFGYDDAGAANLAGVLLPDILTYNYNNSAGFLNGRKLVDDVIDIELGLVTNGAVTTDGVGPHTDLLRRFPFLGVPH